MKRIFYILFLMVVVACGGNKSEYFDEMLKDKLGHLRGAEIGNSIEQVKKLEDANFLRDEMPDYLHYDYNVDMGNSYTVTYDFSSENELYEIELAVFLDVVEDAGKLFQDYTDYFTRKYGKGKNADDGYMVWLDRSAQKNIEVAMIDDSQSYGYLSIIIRDLDY